jgi:hypothetical protein
MRIDNKSLFPYRGKYGSCPPLNFGRTKTHMQSVTGTSILLTDAYDGLIGPVWIAIPDPAFSDPDTMPVPPYLIARALHAYEVVTQAATKGRDEIVAYARTHMSPTSAMQASIDVIVRTPQGFMLVEVHKRREDPNGPGKFSHSAQLPLSSHLVVGTNEVWPVNPIPARTKTGLTPMYIFHADDVKNMSDKTLDLILRRTPSVLARNQGREYGEIWDEELEQDLTNWDTPFLLRILARSISGNTKVGRSDTTTSGLWTYWVSRDGRKPRKLADFTNPLVYTGATLSFLAWSAYGNLEEDLVRKTEDLLR